MGFIQKYVLKLFLFCNKKCFNEQNNSEEKVHAMPCHAVTSKQMQNIFLMQNKVNYNPSFKGLKSYLTFKQVITLTIILLKRFSDW